MKKLIKNSIKCKKCGDVITSRSVHDFVECSCGSCFVDGGLDYHRVGGDPEFIEDLSEYEDVPGHHVETINHFGRRGDFWTTRNLKELAEAYEDMWYLLKIEDEDGREVYRSEGYMD